MFLIQIMKQYYSLAHIEYTAFGEHQFESVGNGPINAVLGGLQRVRGVGSRL